MKYTKIISCLLIVFLTGGVIISSALAQSNLFSGSWKIIKEKSNFGNVDPKVAAPETMMIATAGDSVIVSRTFDGKEAFSERFKIDAPDFETEIDKNTVKIARVNFDKSTKQLVFKSSYEVNGAQFIYSRNETWKINGKELQIERITTMPDKVDRVKAVYVKSN